jgi:hypothetical protein
MISGADQLNAGGGSGEASPKSHHAARYDDIAQRQHRVRDRHLDPREGDQPQGDADDVARQPGEHRPLHQDAADRRPHRGGTEVDRPDRVDPRLEQELRPGIEQDAGEQEERRRERHGEALASLATTMRRESRATSVIGTPCETSSACVAGAMIAKARGPEVQTRAKSASV